MVTTSAILNIACAHVRAKCDHCSYQQQALSVQALNACDAVFARCSRARALRAIVSKHARPAAVSGRPIQLAAVLVRCCARLEFGGFRFLSVPLPLPDPMHLSRNWPCAVVVAFDHHKLDVDRRALDRKHC